MGQRFRQNSIQCLTDIVRFSRLSVDNDQCVYIFSVWAQVLIFFTFLIQIVLSVFILKIITACSSTARPGLWILE